MEFRKLALAAALIAAGTTTAFANQDTLATTDKSDKSAQSQSSMASTNGAAADKSASASTNGSTASSTNGASASGSLSGSSAAGDESVRQLQQALKDKGFNPGPIDGIMGPRTQAALDQSKQAGVTDLPGMSAATSASASTNQPSSASTNQPSSASTNQPASSASANQPSAASESASQSKQ